MSEGVAFRFGSDRLMSLTLRAFPISRSALAPVFPADRRNRR